MVTNCWYHLECSCATVSNIDYLSHGCVISKQFSTVRE